MSIQQSHAKPGIDAGELGDKNGKFICTKVLT